MLLSAELNSAKFIAFLQKENKDSLHKKLYKSNFEYKNLVLKFIVIESSVFENFKLIVFEYIKR